MIRNLFEQLQLAAKTASSEEDLRLNTEHHLKNFFDKWDIDYSVKYEAGKKFGLAKGRIDALWGTVIIEYEPPKTIHQPSKLQHAKKQATDYIEGLAKDKTDLSNFRGVVYDGYKLYFCRWNENKDCFEWEGGAFDEQSLKYFLNILRISSRRAFHLEYLIKDFGFESKLALDCISTFYTLLAKNKNVHVDLLYGEWKRLFGKIYGYDKTKFKRITKKVKQEITHFKVNDEEDIERLFFSIHTYYSFVVKLIAAEIAISSVEDVSESYIDKLALIKSDAELKNTLAEIEDGGKFRDHGIHNFLETDFFSWYLDEWKDKNIVHNIRAIIDKIRKYEPNTVKLEISESRDLLKYLYQGIIPKCFRHDLGEYYTPDWLAENIVKQTSSNFKMGYRFLDDSCGSGTFLIFSIKKIHQEFFKKYQISAENNTKLLNIILDSVVGFDLNPIAVLTSRTNYLIATASLLDYRDKEIVIPIYLADSIILPHEARTIAGKSVYRVPSSLKKVFEIPEEIVKKGLLEPIMENMELYIANESSFDDFRAKLSTDFPKLNIDTIDGIKTLFDLIVSLEKKDQDRIWCRILRNEFAPLFVGRFDYVVGNPPWINWESLPQDYKNEADNVFKKYGLITHTGFKSRIGFGRYDISMAFVYVGMDKYLNDAGKMGYLITQSVFQSDPGEGFRNFSYGIGDKKKFFKILGVYDLTSFQPFDDASTRTSFFFAEKNKKTTYPVPYTYWDETSKIRSNELFAEAKKKIVERKELAKHIDKEINSKWLIAKDVAEYENYTKIIGRSDYQALTGAYSEGANGVYFLEVLKKIGKTLLVKNKTKGLKVDVPSIELIVDSCGREFCVG